MTKYNDHLPLYRQERIFERAGLAIPRSTLAQWVGMCGVQLQPLVDALKEQILQHRVLHADETPVAMLSPGKGKTQRAYLWTYCPGAFEDLRAVVYDFADSRAGEHARNFLGNWKGQLVCDDFTGYKALFAQGITELGCMEHSRPLSSTISTWRAKATLHRMPCSTLASSTRSSGKCSSFLRNCDWKSGNNVRGRLPMHSMRG